MQVKKQQLELYMEQQTGSKLKKEYVKAVYCHPAYLTHMQSTSCKMPGWMKHKMESRLLGEISITSNMQMTLPLWQSEEDLKSLLMKVKEESEKAGLKLSIQKTEFIAPGPIKYMVPSWQIYGEKSGDSGRFYLFSWAPKSLQMVIAAIKRHLLLGRKAMINLDSAIKGRDITLLTKVHIVKAMVFPVVMYGYDSWIIKNAEC